jgi:hypothetical protein
MGVITYDQLLDVTGVLAASSLAVMGLFVVPYQRYHLLILFSLYGSLIYDVHKSETRLSRVHVFGENISLKVVCHTGAGSCTNLAGASIA